MKLPFISVIIPVKGEKEYLRRCIESLKKSDYQKDKYEIIVVVDKKGDSRAKEFENKYGVKVFLNNKIGSAANRNLGVSKASSRSRYFLFTDADCIVHKNWMRTLVDNLEKRKEFDVIGGPNLIPKDDSGIQHVTGYVEQTIIGGGVTAQSAARKKALEVNSLPTCNAGYRKELWLKNKQDERLIIGQDGELNLRLRMKGHRFLLIPDAIVWHHRTRSISGQFRRMFKYGEATSKIWKLHPSQIMKRWYALAVLMAGVTGAVLLIAGFFYAFLQVVLIYLVLIYLVLVLMASVTVVVRYPAFVSLLSPIILIGQHVSYGLGMVKGLFSRI